MGDRLVLIVVSLLTLLVMCGLLLVGIMWVPARVKDLEKRLDKMEELSAQVAVMHDRLGELDKLEKQLKETAIAAAPLARIDSTIDEVTKKLDEVLVPAVNDIKGRVVSRSDLDRLANQINQISQKLGEAPRSDPEVQKLAKEVAELKVLVDDTRKKVETSSGNLSKDLKRLELELQKLQALMQRGGTTPATQ